MRNIFSILGKHIVVTLLLGGALLLLLGLGLLLRPQTVLVVLRYALAVVSLICGVYLLFLAIRYGVKR